MSEELKDTLTEEETNIPTDPDVELEEESSNDTEGTSEPTDETSNEGEVRGEEGGDTEYTPNLTYKVMGQIKEFDERVKPLIKSKEDEEFFRDLFERADGINHIKEHRDRLAQELEAIRHGYQEVETRLNNVIKNASMADKLLEHGDVIGAMQKLGFSEQHILEAARILVSDEQERNMYLQQSNLIRQKVEKDLREQELQGQLSTQEQAINEQMAELAMQRLNMEVIKPEVKEIADKFNEIYKDKNWNFVNEVIAYAAMEENLGRELSPEEAVRAVAEKYRPLLYSNNTTMQPQNNTIIKKNTIRRPSGSGGIGAKKYKSLQDMIAAGVVDI